MQEITASIRPCGNITVAIEPGRALVANAGILVTTVFGTATRGTTKWVYIETGSYNGLIESIETSERNFYPIAVKATDGPYDRYHIGGPSCATLDTPFESVELPKLDVGDRLYILSAGAYTRVCASPFNGFPIPSVCYWQDFNIEPSVDVAVHQKGVVW
jgi:ornithine decarboxylase